MPLRLYNTLSKREEDFVPLKEGIVTMYTCGPTVYGRPHIGNYSSFLMADLLRRWLETGHGYRVTHVKNITDVGHLLHDRDQGDDKVEREAKKEQLHPLEIARRYTEQYLEDERLLHFLEPNHRPRASAFIKEQLTIVKTLIQSGHAYETADGVYFAVTSKTPTPYGMLSGNTLENLSAGARVEVKEAKRHPADFALWKKCVGENAEHVLRWSFATGEIATSTGEDASAGFPGWHIECSAMSSALLGKQIDIHTGGEDNIFPHHECEIAQSESAFKVHPFVRMWVHRRRIDMGSEKMSKSLGNVLNLPDIVAKGFDPLDLRYYLLSVHYRTNLKFSWKGLEDAKKARRRIVEWGDELKRLAQQDRHLWVRDIPHPQMAEIPTKALRDFSDVMDHDLNTPAALAVLFDAMNEYYAHAPFAEKTHKQFIDLFEKARYTFGCFEEEVRSIPADVQELVTAREEARKQKDFAESDRLRKEIEKKGFSVRDTERGSEVKRG